MKKTISILMVSLVLMASCKETAKKNQDEEAIPPQKISKNEAPDRNTLCKINGEPWSYTEASGIIVSDKKKSARILKLTFTKQVNPGKESVALSFDEATKELLEASVQMKQPGKDGKRIHAIYLYNERTTNSNPKSKGTGQVTIGNGVASGTAQLQNLRIQYESSLLDDQEDAEITVTDLSFSNIAFSDVKKEMEAIYKNSK
jgi:hypothetical protein